MNNEKKEELKVFGATIQGFARAYINLEIIAGSKVKNLISDIEVNEWYPFEILRELEGIVIEHYKSVEPILERIGMEMMLIWYKFGPGKEIIDEGADFLSFQSGSQGYISVVKGPEEIVGSFKLVKIDKDKGEALIHSTTPFNKNLERGIIIGGMSAPGDLNYIDVNNDKDEQYFEIKFH